MALRELFAKFTFKFDSAALDRINARVTATGKKVREFARQFDGAALRAAETSEPLNKAAAAVARIGASATKSRGALSSWAANVREGVGALKSVHITRWQRFQLGIEKARRAISNFATNARGAVKSIGRFDAATKSVRKSSGGALGLSQTSFWSGLAASLSNFTAAAESAKKSSSGTLGMLQASFWTGLASSIVGAGTAVTGFTARATIALGRHVTETAVWVDAIQAALTQIAGLDQYTGEREFESARRTASALGLSIRTTIESYKQLRAVGFSRAEGEEFIALTADLKAGFGLTGEAIQRVQLAIGQIKGAGVLQGDELRQLQETGLNINLMWESIAEQMGISVEEAKKLKEEGKVTAAVAIEAFKQSALKTLGTTKAGEAAKKLKDSTLRGLLAGGTAAAENWIIDLAKKVTPGLEDLAQKISGTFTKFAETGVLERLLSTVERLFIDFIDLIVTHWPRVEQILLRVTLGSADAIGDLILSIDTLIDRTLTAVEWIIDNWTAVKIVILAASAAIVTAFTAIGVSAVVNAVKATIAFGSSTLAAISAFAARTGVAAAASNVLTASLSRMAAAATIAKITLVSVAAAATAALAAAVAVIAAIDQAAKLVRETAPEGGIINAWEKSGGVKGFVDFATGGLLYEGEAKALGGKAVTGKAYRQQQGIEARSAPGRGTRATISAALGAAGVVGAPAAPANLTPSARSVILTDQRSTEINVRTSDPAQTARKIGTTVQQIQSTDLAAVEAAIVGANG